MYPSSSYKSSHFVFLPALNCRRVSQKTYEMIQAGNCLQDDIHHGHTVGSPEEANADEDRNARHIIEDNEDKLDRCRTILGSVQKETCNTSR